MEQERVKLGWAHVDRVARLAERLTGKTVVVDAAQAGTVQDARYVRIPRGRELTPHGAYCDIVHELAHYIGCTPEDRAKPNICFEGYEEAEGAEDYDHYAREEEIGAYVQVVLTGAVVGRTEDALLEAYHAYIAGEFEKKVDWVEDRKAAALARIREFEESRQVVVNLLLAETL